MLLNSIPFLDDIKPKFQWSWSPLECKEGFKIYKSSRHTHPSPTTLCCNKIITKSLHEWYDWILRHFLFEKLELTMNFCPIQPHLILTKTNECLCCSSHNVDKIETYRKSKFLSSTFFFHTYLKQVEPFLQSNHHCFCSQKKPLGVSWSPHPSFIDCTRTSTSMSPFLHK